MGNQSSRSAGPDEKFRDHDWGSEISRGEYQLYVAAVAAGAVASSTVLDSRDGSTGAHLLAKRGDVPALEALSAAHVLQQEVKKNKKGSASDLSRWAGKLWALTDAKGRTPLMAAAKAGRTQAVRYLLVHHAHPTQKDSEGGATAAHLAADAGHEEVLRALAAYTPPHGRHLDRSLVDLPDANGLTPLHHAVWHGRHHIVSLLCGLGATLTAAATWEATRGDIRVSLGATPLHVAAIRGAPRCTLALMAAYAQALSDPRAAHQPPPDPRQVQDGHGYIPFAVAQWYGHTSTQLLAMLHPLTPLPSILAERERLEREDAAHGAAAGVPRLEEIAAQAAQAVLLAQLDRAQAALDSAWGAVAAKPASKRPSLECRASPLKQQQPPLPSHPQQASASVPLTSVAAAGPPGSAAQHHPNNLSRASPAAPALLPAPAAHAGQAATGSHHHHHHHHVSQAPHLQTLPESAPVAAVGGDEGSAATQGPQAPPTQPSKQQAVQAQAAGMSKTTSVPCMKQLTKQATSDAQIAAAAASTPPPFSAAGAQQTASPSLFLEATGLAATVRARAAAGSHGAVPSRTSHDRLHRHHRPVQRCVTTGSINIKLSGAPSHEAAAATSRPDSPAPAQVMVAPTLSRLSHHLHKGSMAHSISIGEVAGARAQAVQHARSGTPSHGSDESASPPDISRPDTPDPAAAAAGQHHVPQRTHSFTLATQLPSVIRMLHLLSSTWGWEPEELGQQLTHELSRELSASPSTQLPAVAEDEGAGAEAASATDGSGHKPGGSSPASKGAAIPAAKAPGGAEPGLAALPQTAARLLAQSQKNSSSWCDLAGAEAASRQAAAAAEGHGCGGKAGSSQEQQAREAGACCAHRPNLKRHSASEVKEAITPLISPHKLPGPADTVPADPSCAAAAHPAINVVGLEGGRAAHRTRSFTIGTQLPSVVHMLRVLGLGTILDPSARLVDSALEAQIRTAIDLLRMHRLTYGVGGHPAAAPALTVPPGAALRDMPGCAPSGSTLVSQASAAGAAGAPNTHPTGNSPWAAAMQTAEPGTVPAASAGSSSRLSGEFSRAHALLQPVASSLGGLAAGSHSGCPLEALTRFNRISSRVTSGRNSFSSEAEGEVCGVCLDNAQQFVSMAGCAHTMCVTCTRELLRLHAAKTPRCPFCRRIIGGLQAVAPTSAQLRAVQREQQQPKFVEF